MPPNTPNVVLVTQQYRQLSSKPPGGGGANLGNIFTNAQNAQSTKPGETLEQMVLT